MIKEAVSDQRIVVKVGANLIGPSHGSGRCTTMSLSLLCLLPRKLAASVLRVHLWVPCLGCFIQRLWNGCTHTNLPSCLLSKQINNETNTESAS